MNLRALKIIVTAMGVVLVTGVVVLVVTIAERLAHRPLPPPQAFTAPAVAVPQGATIEAIGTGPDRIVVGIRLSNGARQLLVLDLQTGRLLGTIPLQTE